MLSNLIICRKSHTIWGVFMFRNDPQKGEAELRDCKFESNKKALQILISLELSLLLAPLGKLQLQLLALK